MDRDYEANVPLLRGLDEPKSAPSVVQVPREKVRRLANAYYHYIDETGLPKLLKDAIEGVIFSAETVE